MPDIYSNLHGTTESTYVIGSDQTAGDRSVVFKSSTGSVTLKTTPGVGAKTITIPAQDGTVALTSDIVAAVPGGATRQVQFNDAGAFSGNTGLIYKADGVLQSSYFQLGGDLQVVPVVGGQSVVRSYWGLQLGGLRGEEIYNPSNFGVNSPPTANGIGTSDSFVVGISAGNNVSASYSTTGTVLALFAKSWQTNYIFLDCRDSSNTTKAKIDLKGNISGSGYFQLGSIAVASLPTAPDGSMIYANNALKPGESSGTGTGVVAIRTGGTWKRLNDYATLQT